MNAITDNSAQTTLANEADALDKVEQLLHHLRDLADTCGKLASQNQHRADIAADIQEAAGSNTDRAETFADLSTVFNEQMTTIGGLLGHGIREITENIEEAQSLYVQALSSPEPQVRKGLAAYMDSFLSIQWAKTASTEHSLTFGVLCDAHFPGMDSAGSFDETKALARWLSRQLLVPESRIRVCPFPLYPEYSLDDLETLVCSVFAAQTSDASIHEVPWEESPEQYQNHEDIYPVVFLVTVDAENFEQSVRLSMHISEGSVINKERTLLRMPFTVDGITRSAVVFPCHIAWPFSAMNAGAFESTASLFKEALDDLQESGITLSRVVAEIRYHAVSPPRILIELSEKDTNALYKIIHGTTVDNLDYFIQELLTLAEEFGLDNVCYRSAPNAPLQYYFEPELAEVANA